MNLVQRAQSYKTTRVDHILGILINRTLIAIEIEMSEQIAGVVIREVHLFLYYYISAILSMGIAGFLLKYSFNSASFVAVEKKELHM